MTATHPGIFREEGKGPLSIPLALRHARENNYGITIDLDGEVTKIAADVLRERCEELCREYTKEGKPLEGVVSYTCTVSQAIVRCVLNVISEV